ncbi:MAG: type II toxin-antitoxin system HicA family toxin [Deltaproteobacteria bacterium]|nr:type II toxin-antitoxin system HicA family toxin [Deltaproteobacteria bacterium]
MSKHDKLVKRLLTHPIDFTWDEMTALLIGFGYTRVKAGKTGGSRVRFDHRTSDPIILHRPHPAPTLKRYQIEQVEEILKRGDLL